VTSPVETQPERTALAWQRTGLGIMAVAGLLAHRALESEQPVHLAVAGVTALFGLSLLGWLAPLRYRQVRRGLPTGTVAPPHGVALAATLAVVAASAAALVAVLTPLAAP
jgi:putative membrane protein